MSGPARARAHAVRNRQRVSEAMLARLLGVLVLAPLIYLTAGPRMQEAEAQVLFWTAAHLLVGVTWSGTAAVLHHGGHAIPVYLSSACSSSLVISCLAAVAAVGLRVSVPRKVAGLAAGAGVALAMNLVRVWLLLATGEWFGTGPMLIEHGALGPAVTLASGVAGLFTLLGVAYGLRRQRSGPRHDEPTG